MDTGPVDFNFFLNRKYALLAQQADAGTTNAASGAITANAQAGALGAAAGLDRVRTKLMPAESAATIAQQGAQTNLLTQQASVVVPESTARIAQMGAETALTGTNNKIATRNSLTGILGGAAGTLPALVPPTVAGQPFRLGAGISTSRPARLTAETDADYMNRTGWGS